MNDATVLGRIAPIVMYLLGMSNEMETPKYRIFSQTMDQSFIRLAKIRDSMVSINSIVVYRMTYSDPVLVLSDGEEFVYYVITMKVKVDEEKLESISARVIFSDEFIEQERIEFHVDDTDFIEILNGVIGL